MHNQSLHHVARRPLRVLRTGVLAMGLILAPAPAFGAGPEERRSQDENVRDAANFMRNGVKEYRKGNLEAARAAFAQAWQMNPHTAIAANLGAVEMRLGLYRQAAEHWAFCL